MAYSIRVSKKGFNVNNCADFETALDARYPSLKIAFEGSFTTTSSASPQTIVTHNLGYAPVFWLYVVDNYIYSTGRTILATSGYSQFFRVNGTDLVYDGGLGSVINGYYYVFHVPLTTNITYASVSNTATTAGAGSDNYGIKVSKSGFDVKTTAPKNLAWSSQYPSPIIQKIDTGTLSAGVTKSIAHGLGYAPQYFTYLYDVFSDSRWQSAYNSDDFSTSADNTNVNMTFGLGVDYSVMTLKDQI